MYRTDLHGQFYMCTKTNTVGKVILFLYFCNKHSAKITFESTYIPSIYKYSSQKKESIYEINKKQWQAGKTETFGMKRKRIIAMATARDIYRKRKQYFK